jgi:hypothetical protein
VLRIERDRQGAVRVFPGPNLAVKPAAPRFQEPVELDETIDVEVPQQAVMDPPVIEDASEPVIAEVADTPPVVEAETVPDVSEEAAVEGVVAEEKPRRLRARKTTGTRAPKTAKPRARKTTRANH